MTDLASYLEPGQRIFVAGSSNEPTALLEELGRATLPAGLHFIQFPLAGYNRCDFTAFADDVLFTTFFMTPHLREADQRRLQFLPMQMRAVYDYLATDVNVVLLQVARNANGELCIGPNVDFAEAALGCADVVIVELNHAFVAPAGCPVIDQRRITHMVESNRPLFELAPPVVDAAAGRIGELVAGLINDGDCIQTGIGGIPAAILARLGEKNDLGMHGGIVDDGGMKLINDGNINGTNKSIDNGRHVAGMALGSHGLVDWLAQTPQVVFRPASYTHETRVIAEIDNFFSINSVLEVDLMGQANAEMLDGRQVSGTGGLMDFVRGARMARGGKSILAIKSTAAGGRFSRIVPRLGSRGVASCARADIDHVVTEHGVADLRDKSIGERADALIAIADPAFQGELDDARRDTEGTRRWA